MSWPVKNQSAVCFGGRALTQIKTFFSNPHKGFFFFTSGGSVLPSRHTWKRSLTTDRTQTSVPNPLRVISAITIYRSKRTHFPRPINASIHLKVNYLHREAKVTVPPLSAHFIFTFVKRKKPAFLRAAPSPEWLHFNSAGFSFRELFFSQVRGERGRQTENVCPNQRGTWDQRSAKQRQGHTDASQASSVCACVCVCVCARVC